MGLCKCVKKRVTNQFCFEHRVNVCEYCIVAEHSQCIVQSYLQWLNDSQYDPTCFFCKSPLDGQPCTRLVCYDVFHSSCLERWGSLHPPHTAPAGFKCPQCSAPVFPAPQLASPVALALKDALASWHWSRKAMGTLKKSDEVTYISSPQQKDDIVTVVEGSTLRTTEEAIPNYVEAGIPAKKSLASLSTPSSVSRDPDDKKYEKRPIAMSLTRWCKIKQPFGACTGRKSSRRRLLLLSVVVMCLVLAFLFVRRGNSGPGEAYLDPVFDPLNNPNIRVQEEA
ncbi:Zinc finger RING-type [Trinorchestia longiramus]|nr:Zinc finger RING-type [Trinorchestia longiramus]